MPALARQLTNLPTLDDAREVLTIPSTGGSEQRLRTLDPGPKPSVKLDAGSAIQRSARKLGYTRKPAVVDRCDGSPDGS